MAEQEIIKHTKKAYKVWGDKEHTFWHKLKDFLLEIFIIVFAVTISIWLHNWSEHRSEQAQVKDFLTDLADDLQKDIESLSASQEQLAIANREFINLQNITGEEIDSMNRIHSTILLNTNQIIRQNFGADYEGFKSSGKMGLIENKKLKKKILEYNQETLPSLQAAEAVYNQQMNKTMDYATGNIDKTDRELLLNPKFKVLMRVDIQWINSITQGYTAAIKKANDIITDIQNEQKD